MDYRNTPQWHTMNKYFKMCKAFYEYREIGVSGLFLTFYGVYVVIGEGLHCSHKKADNDA